MKTISKLLALLLALVMVFSLTACGGEGTKTGTQAPETNAPETQAPETQAPETQAQSPASEAPQTEPAEVETDAPATEPVETEPVQTDAPAPEADSIFGKYVSELDFTQLMALSGETMDEEDAELYTKLFEGVDNVRVAFEFSEDNTFRFFADQESLEAAMEIMIDNIAGILPDMFGMSEEELTEMLSSQGMTMDDLLESMREDLDTTELLNAEELQAEGTFRLDGDKLWLTTDDGEEDPDSYAVVKFEGDTFTILEIPGEDDEAYSELLPWEFVKEDAQVRDPEPALTSLGKYMGTISIAFMKDTFMTEESSEEDADLYMRLLEGADDLSLYFEFFEGNRIVFSMDPESMTKLAETMINNLPRILPDMFGMSEEELTEMLSSQGMTMDDLLAAMREQLDTGELLDGEFYKDGSYRLDGDKLYITEDGEKENPDSYMVVELTDEVLVIKEVVGEDEDSMTQFAELLPWTFTRVD